MKLFPKFKIKTSNTFFVRTVCKYCLSGPSFYFRAIKKIIRKSPGKKQLYNYEKVNYECSKSTILYRRINLNEMSFSINFTEFNPKIHRQRGLSRKNNFDDFIYCGCSRTIWVFNDTSSKGRKEIELRKSRNFFDKEFTF